MKKLPTVLICLCLLAGCGSSPASSPDTDNVAISTTSDPGDYSEPPTDAGALGGGGSGGSGDNRGGASGGSPAGASERSIEGAGPTLSDDYPESFGNVYRDDRMKCAYFSNPSDYEVRVHSMSVESPFRVVTGCTPEGRKHPAEPACAEGIVFAALDANGCSAGVEFENGTDFSRNYTTELVWRLSVSCTGTATDPCSSPTVAAANPTPEQPVQVQWTATRSLRFCGATDYADESGNPADGGGTEPSNGCTTPRGPNPTPNAAPSESPHRSTSTGTGTE